VLRKQPADFITRTIIQPVLFVFVLGYISPRIGQPAAGSAAQTATTLLAGMLAIVIRPVMMSWMARRLWGSRPVVGR